MATLLVDINGSVTCKAKIMNPFQTSFTIWQDSLLCVEERVSGEMKVQTSFENEDEQDNNFRLNVYSSNLERRQSPGI